MARDSEPSRSRIALRVGGCAIRERTSSTNASAIVEPRAALARVRRQTFVTAGREPLS
jgi:hypothetical protein